MTKEEALELIASRPIKHHILHNGVIQELELLTNSKSHLIFCFDSNPDRRAFDDALGLILYDFPSDFDYQAYKQMKNQ